MRKDNPKMLKTNSDQIAEEDVKVFSDRNFEVGDWVRRFRIPPDASCNKVGQVTEVWRARAVVWNEDFHVHELEFVSRAGDMEGCQG